MKSSATVRSDLSLPSELHQALKSAVALRKTTMKSAIEQGILMWLRQEPSQDIDHRSSGCGRGRYHLSTALQASRGATSGGAHNAGAHSARPAARAVFRPSGTGTSSTCEGRNGDTAPALNASRSPVRRSPHRPEGWMLCGQPHWKEILCAAHPVQVKT